MKLTAVTAQSVFHNIHTLFVIIRGFASIQNSVLSTVLSGEGSLS